MKELSVPLNLRVFQEDLDRLERLAEILPMPKSAIAREALHRGLEILERAAAAPGDLGKLAALASLSEAEKPEKKAKKGAR